MKTKIFRILAAVLLIIPMSFNSCKKTDEVLPSEPVPINLTGDQVSVIESGNSFAFDILRQSIKKRR